MDAMQKRWSGLCRTLDLAGPVDEVLTDLVQRYREPHRAYHNLDHIAACLAMLDEVASDARDVRALEMALWFHDAVYVPGNADNERLSAELAERSLQRLSADEGVVRQVVALVMATEHHAAPAGGSNPPLSGDEALIADIDLSILAAPAADYDRYAANIRSEARLPDDAFNPRRAAFLKGMLARPAIFHTRHFRERHEPTARANMGRELASLGGHDRS